MKEDLRDKNEVEEKNLREEDLLSGKYFYIKVIFAHLEKRNQNMTLVESPAENLHKKTNPGNDLEMKIN